MQENNISLEQFNLNTFKFENLVSIFSLDQAEIYTQAINNAILSKIYKELKLLNLQQLLVVKIK